MGFNWAYKAIFLKVESLTLSQLFLITAFRLIKLYSFHYGYNEGLFL